MAIQMRRGANSDFDPSKMLPGEIAVTTDGTRKVYAAFQANDVKELASKDDVQGLINGFTSVVDKEIVEAEQRIESKAETVLGTIPDTYETVSQKADEAVRTKAYAIVCSASGVNPIAKDSSNDYLRNLKLFGQTTQGKNPSPNNQQPLESKGKMGNLIDEKKIFGNANFLLTDGYYVGNIGDFFMLYSTELISGFAKNQQYTIQIICKTNSTTDNSRFAVIYTDGTTEDFIIGNSTTERKLTHTTIANKSVQKIHFNYGNAAILYVKDFQINEGTTALPYRPYSGQKEIESGVYGKNLVNLFGTTSEYTGCEVLSDGTFVNTGTDTRNAFYFALLAYKDKEFLRNITYKEIGIGYCTILFTITDDTNKLVFKHSGDLNDISVELYFAEKGYFILSFNVTGTNPSVVNGLRVEDIMIRRAEITDGTYEPYTKQSHISLVGDGLKGIPVTDSSLATYTDENGQMWCADVKDNERGVNVLKTNTEVLDGSDDEGWTRTTDGQTGTIRFQRVFPNCLNKFQTSLCSHFRNVNYAWANSPYGIYSDYNGAEKVKFFRQPNENVNTLADWKAWLAENPITVTYLLETPIETPLTASELESYKALHSNYGVTTMMNDCDAEMEVQYNADTRTYIDNKFAALAAQLV